MVNKKQDKLLSNVKANVSKNKNIKKKVGGFRDENASTVAAAAELAAAAALAAAKKTEHEKHVENVLKLLTDHTNLCKYHNKQQIHDILNKLLIIFNELGVNTTGINEIINKC